MAKSFDYFDDCEKCHGPVRYKSRFELVRDWLAFEVVMVLPHWLVHTEPGFRIQLFFLQYAGGHAYTCICPEKVLR